MAQRINIQLGVQADVNQARSQIQQLQKDLSALTQVKFQDGSLIPGLDPKSLGEANVQITQLKNALNSAFNVKTGKLDLGQFQASLQKSNLDINTLKLTFQSLGPAGTTAFADLAKAVASAEAPVLRVGDGIRKFMTTFANSARYMVATRALNTFVGSIQNALNYAQDLNKSLNNIAIVTGASTDKMAEFAAQANKAAQRLSVTTTGYTDAALIYYQQGLNDQEVAARTETTMKLSNVTGESAQEVSSYMTAIWNNFYDGSQSIEEFADKITALGAATASSSAEIAGGLQQFAAVANTVGLSYDYAATALATIVAQTRQSESTVGNGLRTIFSRMQGLKLDGETDDGITLNKYSQALADVGVNALDANGELRDMDSILNDLGAKWQTLSRAQQVALAQTVGGVRQYTTLVALMENWGKFQENLSIAQGAEGTLQRQQEIYERSWEASSKRVRAAAQSIYQDIIDDKFFIGLNDLFAGLLKTIDQVIKGLGGVKGVLSAVSAIVLTLFNGQIADKVDRFVISLNNLYHPENIDKLKQEYLGAFKDFVGNTGNEALDKMTSSYATNALNSELELKSKILALSKNLSKENQEIANNIYKQVEAAQDLVIVESKALQETERQGSGHVATGIQVTALERALTNRQVRASMGDDFLESFSDININAASLREAKTFLKQNDAMNAFINSVDSMVSGVSANNLKEVQQILLGIQETTKDDIRVTEEFKKIWGEMANAKGPEEMRSKLEELNNYIIETFGVQDGGSLKNELANLIEGIPIEALTGRTKKVVEQLRNELSQNTKQAQAVAAAEIEKVSGDAALKTFGDNVETFGQKVSNFARSASSMAMQINGIRGAITALNDKDIAPWEQFVRVITGFGMAFGPNGVGTQFIQGFGKFRTEWNNLDSAVLESNLQKSQNDLNILNTNYYRSQKDFNQQALLLQGNIKSNAIGKEVSTQDILNYQNGNRADIEISSLNRIQKFAIQNPEQYQNLIKDIQKLDEVQKKMAQGQAEYATQAEALKASIKQQSEAFAAAPGPIARFGASLKAAFAGLATQLVVMAAIAAAIWAIKTAWENWYKTTTEGRIETRINEIQKLDENIQNLKTSIEETKRQIEGLDEFDEKLTDAQWELNNIAEKDSYEFKNIVSETNLELMQTVKSMGLWEDAIIKINDQGLFEIQNQKELNKLLQERLSVEESRLWQLEEMKTRRQQEAQFLEDSKEDYETLATGLQTVSYENKNTPYKVGQTKTRERKVDKFSEEETNNLLSTLQQVATDLKLPDIKSLSNVRDDNAEAIRKALVDDAGFSPEVFDALFKNENADTLWDSLSNIEQTIVETGKTPEAEAIQYGKMFAEQNLDKKEYANWTSEDFKSYYDYINGLKKSYSDEEIRNFDYKPTWLSKEYRDTAFYKENASDYAIGENSFLNMYGGVGSGQYDQATDIKKEFIAYALPDKYELNDSGSLKDIEKNVIVADKEISEIFELENLQTRYNEEVLNEMAKADNESYQDWKKKQSPGQNGEEEEKVEDNTWSTNTKLQDQEILGYMDKENAEAWLLLSKEVEEYAESLKALYPDLEDQDEALKVVAWDAKLAAEGYEELTENGESWIKKIKKGSPGAEKALLSLSETMQKVVGLSDNFKEMGVDIDSEFAAFLKVPEHLELVEKAANGDVEALKELQKQAFLIAEMKLFDERTEGLSEEEKGKLKTKIESMYDYIQNEINTGDSLVLGRDVEISPNFYSDLSKIVAATSRTKEEAEAALASMNLNVADFDLVPVPHVDTQINEVDEHKDPADPKKTIPKITWKTTTRQTSWHAVPKGAVKAWADQPGNGVGTTNISENENAAETIYGNQRISLGNGEYLTGASGGADANGQATLSEDQLNDLLTFVDNNRDNFETRGLPSGAGLADSLGLGDGSGGGGGGGSGSGGKEREQKAYGEEIERYHYLLKTIDAVNKKYDELENARKKAYGTDEIEIMDQEIENLQEQIGLQKTYLDAISQDYLSDRAAIEAYGAIFDENGNIINYEEIYRRQIDLVNSAAGDDEAADEAYEQFKKVLEQYEKTNELLQDTKLSYQELLDKAAELNLEKITVSVDYNVAISDRDRKYLEWLFDNMGDDLDKTADRIANLSKQMETYARDAQTYGQAIDAIFEQVGVNDALEKILNGELTTAQMEELGLTKQQIEQIQDYTDKLMETQKAEKELAESGVEQLKEAFSNWNEELDESIEKITSLNNFLGKYRDILGLLNEDIVGSTKALNEQIDAAERQNNIRTISAQQQKFEQAKRNLEMLNDAYQNALNNGDDITAKALEESIKEAEDAIQQAHQDMLDATSEALSALESQWEASLERISKEYAKNMTGMGDISYFEDAYNRQKEMSDWYLDDYEKYYNLNKLVSRINKDLSNDDALVVSGKLNGLLGKINGSLAEGAQISEATVGYYEKELDLIEAQMALEAARNAKSEVRMVRDNEGNMSYVYTANAEEVEKAQENYQEKWYELMNYTTEQQDELQEQMISSMQDFIDRAVEAAEKFGIGTDAFNEELGKIQNDFSATFGYLGSEMDNSFGMMTNMYENWWSSIEDITQNKVSSESDFRKTFGDTLLGQMMNLVSTTDWIDTMNSGVNSTLSEIYNNGQQYVQNQDEILNAAGSSLDSVVNDTSLAVQENQVTASEEMDKLNQKIIEAKPALEEAVGAINNFSDTWGSQMYNLTESTGAAVEQLNAFYEAISKIENISSSKSLFDVDSLMGKNGGSIIDYAAEATQNALSDGYTSAWQNVDLTNALQSAYAAPTVSTAGITSMLNMVPSGSLEQNVHIDANFPNVVNHSEIELAFNNMQLAATQYVNRK